LFAAPRREPRALDTDEFTRLNKIVKLVVRLRGATARDRMKRELEYVYGAEGTGRIGLCLDQLLAGLDSLGLDRAIAFSVIESVAMDSVPPLRRQAYELLHAHKNALGSFLNLTTPDSSSLMSFAAAARTRSRSAISWPLLKTFPV
jgi:hypothetical protein